MNIVMTVSINCNYCYYPLKLSHTLMNESLYRIFVAFENIVGFDFQLFSCNK